MDPERGSRDKEAEGPGQARSQHQELRGFWGHRWAFVCTGGLLVLCTPCLLPKFRGVPPLPSSQVWGVPLQGKERFSVNRVPGDERFMKHISLINLRGSRGWGAKGHIN